MSKTVLVLGGGTGGIVTANELSRLAGNDGEINPLKIILFEREEKNVHGPLLLWLMAGKRAPDQVYRATSRLSGNGIEVVLGDIEKVDPRAVSVTVGGKEYQGEFMVVALGMEQKPYHRLNDFGYDFHTVEGAEALHAHLERFGGGKVAVVVPSLPLKGPTAPYQAAMLIQGLLREKGLNKVSEVSLYSPEAEPLPLFGTGLSQAVRTQLDEKRIHYYPKHQLTSATYNTLSFENGTTAAYDLLVYTPRFECPKVIRQSELAGSSGWIEVDPHTLETSFPNVYAIGDVVNISLTLGDRLPKTGTVAQAQAKTVAHNLAWRIFGSKEGQKAYSGEGVLYLETGDGKASTVEGKFYGWPFPEVSIKKPHHFRRLSKVWSEKVWWFQNF